jgi:hypothetical protein
MLKKIGVLVGFCNTTLSWVYQLYEAPVEITQKLNILISKDASDFVLFKCCTILLVRSGVASSEGTRYPRHPVGHQRISEKRHHHLASKKDTVVDQT